MSDEKSYSEQEITERLASELPHWEYRDGWVRRKYKTIGWPYTLLVVNAVGHIAEAACHHPDLSVSYGEVTVKLMTHSAKGVTDKDFELAKLIEQHVTWLPGEGSPLDGFEKGMKKKWTR
ncbi:MAG: 4a-hydroxytetrahydrobiopterin dehydratase [Phycisphaera sp.]|nr:4a-hydroxytetrahydrobiopterin dehydratase [Phycisphaera sp.]